MSKVVIFGTGDFARIASVYFDRDSDHEVVAFTVNERYLEKRELVGRPVVPFEVLTQTHPPDDFTMFVGIGFSKVNEARASVAEECESQGYELVSYLCSKATVIGDLELQPNSFIFENNVIQPFVTIGSDTILWSGNHIGHDTSIGNHCFIASHAVISGNVTIGDYCFVGVNATFRDGISVAPRCIIGAGALVMKDTEEGEIYSVRGTQPMEKKSWELTNF
jgi:sugar O-acyltransferase (sialic acid O-acetyltransferase NeuD family)